MFNYLRFPKKSYCHIWALNKKGNNLSERSQLCFQEAMGKIKLPVDGLIETYLVNKLKHIALENNIDVYYHLNSEIYPSTLFTFQMSSKPRKDVVIIRKK